MIFKQVLLDNITHIHCINDNDYKESLSSESWYASANQSSQISCIRAGGSNLVMVRPGCQLYLESRAHTSSKGGLGACPPPPPRKFLKIRCPNILFLAHFHYYHERYVVHYTKVQAVSIQNDLTWKTKKIFFCFSQFFSQLMVQPKPDKPDCFHWPLCIEVTSRTTWLVHISVTTNHHIQL